MRKQEVLFIAIYTLNKKVYIYHLTKQIPLDYLLEYKIPISLAFFDPIYINKNIEYLNERFVIRVFETDKGLMPDEVEDYLSSLKDSEWKLKTH